MPRPTYVAEEGDVKQKALRDLSILDAQNADLLTRSLRFPIATPAFVERPQTLSLILGSSPIHVAKSVAKAWSQSVDTSAWFFVIQGLVHLARKMWNPNAFAVKVRRLPSDVSTKSGLVENHAGKRVASFSSSF